MKCANAIVTSKIQIGTLSNNNPNDTFVINGRQILDKSWEAVETMQPVDPEAQPVFNGVILGTGESGSSGPYDIPVVSLKPTEGIAVYATGSTGDGGGTIYGDKVYYVNSVDGSTKITYNNYSSIFNSTNVTFTGTTTNISSQLATDALTVRNGTNLSTITPYQMSITNGTISSSLSSSELSMTGAVSSNNTQLNSGGVVVKNASNISTISPTLISTANGVNSSSLTSTAVSVTNGTTTTSLIAAGINISGIGSTIILTNTPNQLSLSPTSMVVTNGTQTTYILPTGMNVFNGSVTGTYTHASINLAGGKLFYDSSSGMIFNSNLGSNSSGVSVRYFDTPSQNASVIFTDGSMVFYNRGGNNQLTLDGTNGDITFNRNNYGNVINVRKPGQVTTNFTLSNSGNFSAFSDTTNNLKLAYNNSDVGGGLTLYNPSGTPMISLSSDTGNISGNFVGTVNATNVNTSTINNRNPAGQKWSFLSIVPPLNTASNISFGSTALGGGAVDQAYTGTDSLGFTYGASGISCSQSGSWKVDFQVVNIPTATTIRLFNNSVAVPYTFTTTGSQAVVSYSAILPNTTLIDMHILASCVGGLSPTNFSLSIFSLN
jgi:adhesin/invasin